MDPRLPTLPSVALRAPQVLNGNLSTPGSSSDGGVVPQNDGTFKVWTEEATAALLDAWIPTQVEGPRNLPQNIWEEICKCVNTTIGDQQPRNVQQCKSRLDTLKRLHRDQLKPGKQASAGGGTPVRYFELLNQVFGTSGRRILKAKIPGAVDQGVLLDREGLDESDGMSEPGGQNDGPGWHENEQAIELAPTAPTNQDTVRRIAYSPPEGVACQIADIVGPNSRKFKKKKVQIEPREVNNTSKEMTVAVEAVGRMFVGVEQSKMNFLARVEESRNNRHEATMKFEERKLQQQHEFELKKAELAMKERLESQKIELQRLQTELELERLKNNLH